MLKVTCVFMYGSFCRELELACALSCELIAFLFQIIFEKYKSALTLAFPFYQADPIKVEVFTLLSFLQDQISGPRPIQTTTYKY